MSEKMNFMSNEELDKLMHQRNHPTDKEMFDICQFWRSGLDDYEGVWQTRIHPDEYYYKITIKFGIVLVSKTKRLFEEGKDNISYSDLEDFFEFLNDKAIFYSFSIVANMVRCFDGYYLSKGTPDE